MNEKIDHHRMTNARSRHGFEPIQIKAGLGEDAVFVDSYALQGFGAHSLTDLSSAYLMNRVDSKYVVPIQLLNNLLDCLQSDYSILEINKRRSFGYETHYFDTPENTHYLAHHNGRINRFKIRKRTYVDSGTSFLEVKFKDQRKRTNKTRIAWDGVELTNHAIDFLYENGVFNPECLIVVQTGRYQRIALANEQKGERITIDASVVFSDVRSGNEYSLGDWCIVEVKQESSNRDSIFFEWAKSHQIRNLSFSKYCMGVYFTGDAAVKRNNFHSAARRVNAIYKNNNCWAYKAMDIKAMELI